MRTRGKTVDLTASKGSRAGNQNLPGLLGMRSVAAITVVTSHFWLDHAPDVLYSYLANAAYQVDLFFVLSGFLLGYKYLSPTGLTVPARRFMTGRIARVYPAYLLAMVLMLIIHPPWPESEGIVRFAKTLIVTGLSVTMTQSWLPHADAVNGPSWSLSAEVFFYAVLAAIGTYATVHLSVKAQIVWSLALMSASAVALFVVDDSQFGTWFPLFRVAPFLLAAVVGSNFRRIKPHLPVGRLRMSLAQASCLTALTALMALLPKESGPGRQFVSILSIALIVLLAGGGGVVSWVLDTRPMQVLGTASYGIYIYQMPVMFAVAELMNRSELDAVVFLPGLASLIGLSIISGYLFEPAARKWIERRAFAERRATIDRPRPAKEIVIS